MQGTMFFFFLANFHLLSLGGYDMALRVQWLATLLLTPILALPCLALLTSIHSMAYTCTCLALFFQRIYY